MKKPMIGVQPNSVAPPKGFNPMAGIPGVQGGPFPAMSPQQVDEYVSGGAPPGIPMPMGPGGIAFPAPAGPNGEQPTFEYNTADDSLLPLKETICAKCKHGLIIAAAAPVHNRKGREFGEEEGQPFTWDYGVCTFISPPMPLEQLKPIKCSKFTPDDVRTVGVIGTDGTPHRGETEVVQ